MIPILMKDPKIVALMRAIETTLIVVFLTALGNIQTALAMPAGLASFDWHAQLNGLAFSALAGVINAVISYLSAVQKQVASTADAAPAVPAAPPQSGS